MAKRFEFRPTPWGSHMLSGVEIKVKVGPPKVKDISELLGSTYKKGEYEYEFLYEKQVIADHDAYLHRKQQAKLAEMVKQKVTMGEDCSATQDPPARKSDVLSPVIPRARPSLVSQDHAKDVTTSVAQTPIAASQLVPGQVLQPQKTEGQPLLIAGVNNTNTTVPILQANNKVENRQKNATFTGPSNDDPRKPADTIVRDFDAGPDDPFASAELKLINDLEELKSVLMPESDKSNEKIIENKDDSLTFGLRIPSNQPPNSTHSSPVNLSSSNPQTLCNPNYQSHPTYQQPYAMTTNLRASSSSNTSFPIPYYPHYSFNRPMPYLTSGQGVVPNQPVVNSAKTLSSPDLNDIGQIKRPESTPAFCGSNTLRHHLTTPHMVIQQTHHGPTQMNSPIDSQSSWFDETIICFARSHGFPEHHICQLIQLWKRSRINGSDNLESAKRLIINQLRITNSLLNEYGMTSSKRKLKEDCALTISVLCSNDPSRAHHLAKLILDLERQGLSQEVAQSLMIDSVSDPDRIQMRLLNCTKHSNSHNSFTNSPICQPVAPTEQK